MTYLIEGEVVDTYGGDFTYHDLWYEEENGEIIFYEQYYGAKPSPTEMITDEEEIKKLLEEIKN